jgi:hypothetical protein
MRDLQGLKIMAAIIAGGIVGHHGMTPAAVADSALEIAIEIDARAERYGLREGQQQPEHPPEDAEALQPA